MQKSVRRSSVLCWNGTLGVELFLHAAQVWMQVKFTKTAIASRLRTITVLRRRVEFGNNAVPGTPPVFSVGLKLE